MDHIGVERHQVLNVNIFDAKATIDVVRLADLDLGMHFAAESHVVCSINSPYAFLHSNIISTFNLLQAVLLHG